MADRISGDPRREGENGRTGGESAGRILSVGASHKTAPLDILESIALSPEEVGEALPVLRARAGLGEVFLLSTCNRTEIYGTAGDAAAAAGALEAWLLDHASGKKKLRPEHLARRHEREAVDHLFSVGCGADSMMLGETQIAGQIEEALERARQAGTAGGSLTRLVAAAGRACRRARSETAVSRGVISVASATAYLARRIFGELDARTVLIVGAGETGTLAAQHFRKRRPHRILVANRTYEKAERLAAQLEGEAVPFDERVRFLAESDIAVCATHAPEPLFSKETVAEAMTGRASRMLLLIDVSLPRNIAADTAEVENVFLHDMNDLRRIVDHNISRRAAELPAVERIVEHEVDSFYHREAGLEVGPLIRDLRESFEAVREEELSHHLKRFPGEEHEMVRRLTRDMIRKLLHHPTVEIRAAAKHPEVHGEKILWVRRLFGLGDAAKRRERG